jgi:hypothetical protein
MTRQRPALQLRLGAGRNKHSIIWCEQAWE